MGFSLIDLFVPKYNNKNPEKRKEAIETLKDLNILKMMAEKDADQGVREAASKKLAQLQV